MLGRSDRRDRAPARPVATAADVPLRVDGDTDLTRVRVSRLEPGWQRGPLGPGTGARRGARGTRGHLGAGGSAPRLPAESEQVRQEPGHRSGSAERCREELRDRAEVLGLFLLLDLAAGTATVLRARGPAPSVRRRPRRRPACGAQRRGRTAPKRGGGSASRSRPIARRSDVAAPVLGLASSRVMDAETRRTNAGSSGSSSARARWPSRTRYRLATDERPSRRRTIPGSRLPARNSAPCTVSSARDAVKSVGSLTKMVRPSVNERSPSGAGASATARPEIADASSS